MNLRQLAKASTEAVFHELVRRKDAGDRLARSWWNAEEDARRYNDMIWNCAGCGIRTAGVKEMRILGECATFKGVCVPRWVFCPQCYEAKVWEE